MIHSWLTACLLACKFMGEMPCLNLVRVLQTTKREIKKLKQEQQNIAICLAGLYGWQQKKGRRKQIEREKRNGEREHTHFLITSSCRSATFTLRLSERCRCSLRFSYSWVRSISSCLIDAVRLSICNTIQHCSTLRTKVVCLSDMTSTSDISQHSCILTDIIILVSIRTKHDIFVIKGINRTWKHQNIITFCCPPLPSNINICHRSPLFFP